MKKCTCTLKHTHTNRHIQKHTRSCTHDYVTVTDTIFTHPPMCTPYSKQTHRPPTVCVCVQVLCEKKDMCTVGVSSVSPSLKINNCTRKGYTRSVQPTHTHTPSHARKHQLQAKVISPACFAFAYDTCASTKRQNLLARRETLFIPSGSKSGCCVYGSTFVTVS
eukprot:GDKI01006347.1.p2 GENE.GDKI01006347.1~~GDKI01006347.1.p2  ORF type:complete len:164 (+),score=36.55 GDKI01006347.1:207-698(+)